MEITLAHGSGGAATGELIRTVFAKAFDNPILRQMDDSAVVPGSGQLAVTTDSFVVQPLFFPGGDIGRLAVCGTVNDLLMRGATPKYLTAGFILETGCTTEDLRRIARSMAATADEAGVAIVAGDTKVVEGSGNIYINTAHCRHCVTTGRRSAGQRRHGRPPCSHSLCPHGHRQYRSIRLRPPGQYGCRPAARGR